MRKHFKTMGWPLPDDFNDELQREISPVYDAFIFLEKTKSRFFSRLSFSEVWTFVSAQFSGMDYCDKLFLTELIIDIDAQWTNYLIEAENAKNRCSDRSKTN